MFSEFQTHTNNILKKSGDYFLVLNYINQTKISIIPIPLELESESVYVINTQRMSSDNVTEMTRYLLELRKDVFQIPLKRSAAQLALHLMLFL
jgi:hypothetical protein